MTTAKVVTASLAEALGRSHSSVEAYGVVLRRYGWWGEAKRGRGARPMTSMEAAKLLLATLSAGPSDLTESGFFLTYANLALVPGLDDDPVVEVVREELGLPRTAMFLDYVDGLVRLFRDGRATDLLYHVPDADGGADPARWGDANLAVRVRGPFPLAELSFRLSVKAIGRAADRGGDIKDLTGPQTLRFIDQLFGWAAEAKEKEGADSESARAFDSAIEGLLQSTERGVRFERSIGVREVIAVASHLARPEAD